MPEGVDPERGTQIGGGSGPELGLSTAEALSARQAHGVLEQSLVPRPAGRLAEAEEHLLQALAEDPDNPLLTLEIAELYMRMRRHDLAANAYARTLSIAPTNATAYARLGRLMWHMGRAEDALGFLECALTFDPAHGEALLNLADLRARQADWHPPGAGSDLVAKLAHNSQPLDPGVCLGLTDDPEFHAKRAAICARDLPRRDMAAIPQGAGRMRVGYFGDFTACDPVLSAIACGHDRAAVDVLHYDFGQAEALDPATPGQPMARAVAGLSDDALWQVARDDGLDIAIDLEGYSPMARPGLFSRRVAPIQIGGLGHSGTLGPDMLDYLLCDPMLIPMAQRQHYAERALVLPHGATPIGAASAPVTHDATGAPGGIVLACAAPIRQITPDLFSVWLAVLRSVPEAELRLQATSPPVRDRLRRMAWEAGIAVDRLVFGWLTGTRRLPPDLRHADLLLDSMVKSDVTGVRLALRHQVPVVTLPGRCASSRWSGAALQALGLGELVARDLEDYRQITLRVARRQGLRRRLRNRLAQAQTHSALFDSVDFAQMLEHAYTACLTRQREGFAPDHLSA